MKKTLLLAGLLLALTATVASAAGISVNWGNACWGDVPAGQPDVGLQLEHQHQRPHDRLVQAGRDEDHVRRHRPVHGRHDGSGCGARLVEAGLGRLPLEPRDPQLGRLGARLGPDCLDLWQGLGGGGIGLYYWDTNRMHINAVWAVADPVEAVAETEIFAAQFRIATGKTVGTTACAGCAIPAIWALNYIQVGYLFETVRDGPRLAVRRRQPVPHLAELDAAVRQARPGPQHHLGPGQEPVPVVSS